MHRHRSDDSAGLDVVVTGDTHRNASLHIARADMVRQGAAVLADLLLPACLRHPDVAEQVRKCLAARETGPALTVASEPVMVGNCAAMHSVFHSIRRFAATDAPILVTGESGTGKELAARAIHERSDFRHGPFVAVNCGGLPANLVASELFGHEKGAFTGALNRRIGHIELAGAGTLFLDEIGDLPLDLQANFLRCLETKTIERVGGNTMIPVNIRIVAATNVDLEDAVNRGQFRHDLYFRLNVLRIHLPPLRERTADIELLVRFFIQRMAAEMGLAERQVTARAIEALKAYSWPGNIRELISNIRRALVMAEREMLDIPDLALDGPVVRCGTRSVGMAEFHEAPPAAPRSEPLLKVRDHAEAEAIVAALERNRYNVSKAARDLGIARATIYKRMVKLGIER